MDLHTPHPTIILPNDTEADTNTHTLHSQDPTSTPCRDSKHQTRPSTSYSLGRCNLTQSVKPLFIKESAYLRVPKDVAELIAIMDEPTGAVELRIYEQGSALVYTLAKPTRPINEDPE